MHACKLCLCINVWLIIRLSGMLYWDFDKNQLNVTVKVLTNQGLSGGDTTDDRGRTKLVNLRVGKRASPAYRAKREWCRTRLTVWHIWFPSSYTGMSPFTHQATHQCLHEFRYSPNPYAACRDWQRGSCTGAIDGCTPLERSDELVEGHWSCGGGGGAQTEEQNKIHYVGECKSSGVQGEHWEMSVIRLKIPYLYDFASEI